MRKNDERNDSSYITNKSLQRRMKEGWLGLPERKREQLNRYHNLISLVCLVKHYIML